MGDYQAIITIKDGNAKYMLTHEEYVDDMPVPIAYGVEHAPASAQDAMQRVCDILVGAINDKP